MSNIDDVRKIMPKLRAVDWNWDRGAMEAIASELGLTEEMRESNWITYRDQDTAFSYGFHLRGRQVGRFQVSLDKFDMGEVCLYESDRYQDVLEEQDKAFRIKFKTAAKHIRQWLGKPAFEGGLDEMNRFKEYQRIWGANRAAVWTVKNGNLNLVYDHQDKELPLTLDLLVFPPYLDK